MNRQKLPALLVATLLMTIAMLPRAAHSAMCPDLIESDDCVANDLQPTGTEIIQGPEACTEGEIFSAKVRIKFENGGGANSRYSVGFYVGDRGESPIGGASCTFDSLQPIGETEGETNRENHSDCVHDPIRRVKGGRLRSTTGINSPAVPT